MWVSSIHMISVGALVPRHEAGNPESRFRNAVSTSTASQGDCHQSRKQRTHNHSLPGCVHNIPVW